MRNTILRFGCLTALVVCSCFGVAQIHQPSEAASTTARVMASDYPSAPSATLNMSSWSGQQQGAEPAVSGSKRTTVPTEIRGGEKSPNVVDWQYTSVMGAMFTSSIVNVELTNKCLDQGTCSWVPDAFQSRAAMYGAGIPAEIGIAYLSYKLKEHGHKWWYVPAVAVTAMNAYVAYHASTRIR